MRKALFTALAVALQLVLGLFAIGGYRNEFGGSGDFPFLMWLLLIQIPIVMAVTSKRSIGTRFLAWAAGVVGVTVALYGVRFVSVPLLWRSFEFYTAATLIAALFFAVALIGLLIPWWVLRRGI